MAVNYVTLGNENSTFHRELMKDDYVNIKYSSLECETIPAGTALGQAVEGQTYELMETYMPSYNENNDSFDYDMKFQAWYYGLEKLLFKPYTHNTDGTLNTAIQAAEWSLTDTPANFCELIKKNGKVKNENFDVSLDITGDDLKACPAHITCTFDGTNVLDAISMVVKALDEDTNYWEWWFIGDTLHIGKLKGNEDEVTTLKLGTNISSVSVQEGTIKPIGTLYAFSAARNMSSRYGKTLQEFDIDTQMVITESGEGGSTRTYYYGYYNTTHVITAKMFRSDRRIYSVTDVYDKDAVITFTLNKDEAVSMPLTPTHKGTLISGQAKVIFTNENAIEKTQAIYLTAEQAASTARHITLMLVVQKVTDEGYEDVATIDKYVLEWSGTNVYVGMKLNDTTFYVESFEKYVVALKFSSDSEDEVKGYIGRTYGNPDLMQYKIQSMNYAVDCKGDGTVIFNSCYLPINQQRSRCFSVDGFTINNDNFTEYGLVRGKLPYAWFTDGNDDTLMSFDKRLSCVKTSENGDTEAQIVFDDIYPSMSGTLGDISVKSVEEEDTNGELTGRVLNYCSFDCDFLQDVDTEDFTEDKATIVFTSGNLNGMEFELNIAKSNSDGTTFCIIPNENYNKLIPCENFMPAKGDTYKLVGIDVCYYDDGKPMQTAQTELENRAEQYIKYASANQNVYTMKMIVTSAMHPTFGEAVKLSDIDLDTRVIGLEYPLDLPAADYKVICGNSPSYKRITALESKTLSLK